MVFMDVFFFGSGQIMGWLWIFGDGGMAGDQNLVYIYVILGNFLVIFIVIDINNCQDIYILFIEYFFVLEFIVIVFSDFIGCVFVDIFFNNFFMFISEVYDIIWDFGDGGVDSVISFIYIYEVLGIYMVSIDIVFLIGCQIDIIFGDFIIILLLFVVGFLFIFDCLSNFELLVSFFDELIGVICWFYDFGDGNQFIVFSFIYEFWDMGVYEVWQIVMYFSGCQDMLV